MKKRGLNQVDWAISLGIFLIYLAWFFIFIRPMFAPRAIAALTPDIKDDFEDYTQWSVQKIPVVAISNITGIREPVIVNFTGYNESHIGFTDRNYFVIDNDKMFFLGNLTRGGNLFLLLNSSSTYTKLTPPLAFVAGTSYVAMQNFKAFFLNGLLTSANYRTKTRIKSFDFLLNGVSINQSSNYFSHEKILVKYVVSSDINHTSYVFADKPRIYVFYRPKQPISNNIVLSFTLDNYTSYYANENYKKDFNYGLGDCDNFNSRFINFYDESDSLTITTDVDAAMEVCNTNDTILFNVSMTLTGDHWYKIIFSDENYLSTLNFSKDYFSQLGIAEEVDGIKSSKLDELSVQPYATIKRNWVVPDANNFRITVKNSTTTLLSYGEVPHATADVFVEEYDMWIVDEYANLEKVEVNIQTW